MEQTLQDAYKKQTALNIELEEKKEQHASVDFKMVAFSLGGKDYAIDILKVKEIAKADRFTYVPNTSPFVTGVYNLRGEIIPIIDLRIFFNLESETSDGDEKKESEYENMIIINIGDQKYGTIVDRIEKVAGIQSASIQPPHPLFGDINIKYIYGIVEHENRMYILLDVGRIFGVDSVLGENFEQKEIRMVSNVKESAPVKSEPPRARMGDILSTMQPTQSTQRAPVPAPEITQVEAPKPSPVVEAAPAVVSTPTQAPDPGFKTPALDEIEYKFVIETLKKYQKFHVSSVNESWVKKRYDDWKNQRGDGSPLNDANDTAEFLKPFESKYSSNFWPQEYADSIFALLPDNPAKHIHVWNPGCGAGYEAYSLSCLLHKRYPESKIKVYAHDTDLILISSAPMLRIPDDVQESWYKPYLSRTLSGETIFSPEIRDSVLFEYHDCTHMNVVPQIDVIFTRDFLSYVSNEKLDEVVLDFYEKLKETGFVVIGDNELLLDSTKWLEKMYGSVVSYTKL